MFKYAQYLAGLSGYTLHSERRGYVTEYFAQQDVIAAEKTMREEFIVHKMGVSYKQAARDYNGFQISKAAASFNAIHKAAFE